MNKVIKEVELTADEKSVVLLLAEGDLAMRPQALPIFRKHISDHVRGGSVSPEINFLSEVFSKCPCTVMKMQYRKAILEKSSSRN
jgi:hypothetical protein